ncbi:hypothetical protein T06_12269 [Trichinella sp. T6]|nr:hypothetical protein T06_12269 [Trichinella sp. T6]
MEFKILKFIFGWSSVCVQCFAFKKWKKGGFKKNETRKKQNPSSPFTMKKPPPRPPCQLHLAIFRFHVGKVHDVQPPVLKLPELNEPKTA